MVFQAMGVPLARVLEGIAAAHEARLWPVKLNTVVERGVNDHGCAWTTSSPPPRSFAASTPSCPLGAAHRAEQAHPALVGLLAWIVPALAPRDAP
jgi:hypothetical protein